MDPISTTVELLGGLALFLFGMKLMGDGLQQVAGPRMRDALSVMTSNRFAGVATGCVVTCIIQSSSATTVMLVGFVHAGLVTLTQAIGVIMGANIGTTFTGWLVALVGFKVNITALALPAITIGVIPSLLGNRRYNDWAQVVLGFGILFLGLWFMKESVAGLEQSEAVAAWVSRNSADTLLGVIWAIFLGCVVTVLVQSSSAVLAVTMTLAAQGVIGFETACALALGQNIGTTITANIAALTAATPARQAARAHFLFNFVGVVLALIAFRPLLTMADWIVPGQVLGNGDATGFDIATALAFFHTIFNVANTIILVPFVSQIAWAATKLTGKPRGHEAFGLLYLHPGVMRSTTMALHAARNELSRMLEEVQSMFTRVMKLIATPDAKMGAVADSILGSEQTVDYLERAITEYCVSIAKMEISFNQSRELAGILGAVGDVERMGDHCESLLNLLRRRYDKDVDWCEEATKDLSEIGFKANAFLELLRINLDEPLADLMPRAREIEEMVNQERGRLRSIYVNRLRDGSCSMDHGLIVIDMLTSFEKIGDHSFNVAQMLAGER
jgi:phosphate:Na+ symporter